MTPEQNIERLGLTLPPPPSPSGLYRPVMVAGIMAVTSGHAPVREGGSRIEGRIGQDLTLEEGQEAACRCGLAILSSLRQALGTLDRVKHVLRVYGMVNCTPDFTQHPAVLDGCSRLFADVFGEEAGVGVRSVAGVLCLPGNAPLQIEATFIIGQDG